MSLLDGLRLKSRIVGLQKFRIGRLGKGVEASRKCFVVLVNGFDKTIIEAASRLGVPVSTTHTISSAILGVGSTKRLSAVRWGIAGQIVMGWVLTIPGCFMLGYAIKSALGSVVG